MSDDDRTKWNARYRASAAAPTAPAGLLISVAELLPTRGRALDVAGGSGRNSLWLAARGLDVTLLDISAVALEQARERATAAGLRLNAIEVDLDQAPLPDGPWDTIVCFHFLWRPLFSQAPAVLAPGGWLIVAHPTRRNLERNASPSAQWLLEEGELVTLASDLEVVRYDEDWQPSGRHEARLVARRPVGERSIASGD